jgi:hypothetical protein
MEILERCANDELSVTDVTSVADLRGRVRDASVPMRQFHASDY